jgi:L-arabinose isomerase
MREVAVTEGNKVSAQIRSSASAWMATELATSSRPDEPGDRCRGAKLVDEYREAYSITKEHDRKDSIQVAAKIELGLRAFLEEGGFGAFTDTFQDLHGLISCLESHRSA